MSVEFAQSEIFLQYIFLAALGFIALIGFIAMVSPTWFRRVDNLLGKTVDTSKFQELLERPIDTDRYLSRYTRLIGAGALSTAAFLGFHLL